MRKPSRSMLFRGWMPNFGLEALTGRKAARRKLACELLERRHLMANDLFDGLPVNYCPAIELLLTESSAAQTKQSGGAVRLDAVLSKLDLSVFTSDGDTKERSTHFYVADGQEKGMAIHPSRIAVRFGNGEPESEKLSQLGLSFVRPIDGGYSVYERVNVLSKQSKSALDSKEEVSVAPVFVIQSTRSEAVLLDEIIIALEPGVQASDYFDDNPNFTSYRPLPGTPDQFIAKVAAGVGEAALAVANQVDSDPGVAWVSPNFHQDWQKYFTPNDTRFGNQWHLNNVGQGGGLLDADVDMPEAWDVNQGGSASITIGIIDDGVSIDHPDLDVWTNPGEIPGDSLDNDGNGWVDDVHGWNFVSNNANSQPTTSTDVHGTSVSGVAAAKGNNGLGVAGAAYRSKVLSARIFEGPNVASDANIVAALYYAAGRTFAGTGTWNAAAIVNNSWGGGAPSTALNTALTWGTTLGRQGAGATYFFATGNDFGAVSEPAVQSLSIPGVIAVGATNNRGELSDYSNFGPAVDLVAPSNDTRAGYLAIDTTDRIGASGYDPTDYTGTGANGFGGTSSATPLASGIAALVLAQAELQGIVLTPAQMRNYLRNNTDLLGNGVSPFNVTTGKSNSFGFGRLNAASAITGLGKAEISVTGSSLEYFDAASTINMGTVVVPDFRELTLRVRNQGTNTLDLTNITIAPGPFSIVGGFSDTSLALGEATTFTIRYSPTVSGVETRTISIFSNDLDESVFELNVTATAFTPSVGGVAFEDWDGDGIKDAPDSHIAGRTIYLDSISNGLFDANLGTSTFTKSVPLSIVDNATVTSTLDIVGVSNFLTDVNVKLNISHTYNSDLDITLIAPNGTRVLMVSSAGGSANNFTNTVLDDEAPTSVQTGVAPFTGSFRPFQPLSALDGLGGASVNATWTLEIRDKVTGDTGTLNSWELVFTTGEQATQTRPTGEYSFLGLPNGTYTARQVIPNGWTGAALAGGGHTFTIASPGDYFAGRDFGSGKNNKFYGQVFGDVDSDGVFDATEVGLGGRTLFLDSNENGVMDLPSTTTVSSTTPIVIGDLSTIASTINSPVTGLITDINVRVNISHTFVGDLDVFLVHPDGTQIELFTDVGGGGANFVDTLLDQQALTGVIGTTGFNTAPFTGSYRPEGNLSALNGKSATGVWTLRVTDDAATDVGTLNGWDLIIGGGDYATTTAANGTAALDLPNGAYQVRLAAATDYANTVPTDGLRSGTTSDIALFDQRFGSKTAPKIQNVTFGDGTNQRSMVRGISVDFDSVVSIAPGAFVLERKNGANWVNLDAELTIGFETSLVNNNTRATLGFSGPGVVGRSLADGNYRLTILSANINWNGLQLDGDGNGVGGDNFTRGTAATDNFFRYFGDFEGNRVINGIDLGHFRRANGTLLGDPTFNAVFDYNSDNVINGIDLGRFRMRNGTLLEF